MRYGKTTAFQVLILLTSVSLCSAEVPAADDLQAFFDEQWSIIMDAAPSHMELTSETRHDYWASVAFDCNRALNALATHDERETLLKMFVEKFGEEGPEADLRWMLADFYLLMVSVRHEFEERSQLNEYQDLLARYLVQHLLSDDELLDRYNRLNAWSRNIVGRRDEGTEVFMFADRTRRSIARDDNTIPWVDRQNAIFLMYATSRTDLIERIRNSDDFPEIIDQVYVEWHTWFRSNSYRLRPHDDEPRWMLVDHTVRFDGALSGFRIPELPFADWPEEIIPPNVTMLQTLDQEFPDF